MSGSLEANIMSANLLGRGQCLRLHGLRSNDTLLSSDTFALLDPGSYYCNELRLARPDRVCYPARWR